MARLSRLALAAVLLASMPAAEALAQANAQGSWPIGPVRMFVGFAPGGSTDVITRDIASELEGGQRRPARSRSLDELAPPLPTLSDA
jgi:tripartite-type tricarboxylate transporter receptor subunit TctC